MRRIAVVWGLIACLCLGSGGASAGPEARASFNFKGARVQDAIRLIASQFGLDVVVGKPAAGAMHVECIAFESSRIGLIVADDEITHARETGDERVGEPAILVP